MKTKVFAITLLFSSHPAFQSLKFYNDNNTGRGLKRIAAHSDPLLTKSSMMNTKCEIEIWGGIECTINRVSSDYFDQSEYSGHYNRGVDDIDLVASLGIKMLRYPVLWERHQPNDGQAIDWTFAEKSLNRMKEKSITPVAGLVHHGSGPRYVNFFDGSFENGLAAYAKKVA